MAGFSNIRIDGGRLWDSLMDMARIGATAKGGNNRLALGDLDREARDVFAGWAKAAGCALSIDRMGNMFARRDGAEPSLPPVLIGSHLDTQPTGGKYDGVLGVLGALEVVRTLSDLGIRTRHPVEVVNWTNEEGSRFAPAMLSSGVFAGVYTENWAYARMDADGHELGRELVRIGYQGSEPVGRRPIKAYFEVHIEQGPILEDEGIDIGVVTHGQGQRWYEVTLTGFESHAGSTPMARRRDALLGAARVIEAVNRIGLAHAPRAVATVGIVQSFPNSRNVIPGRVFLTAEIRSPDAGVLAEMDATVQVEVADIARAAGLECDLQTIFSYEPVPFDPGCLDTIRRAAQALGYTHRDIVAGAGHDACNIARVAPSAMIFTPCIDGISHNEAEEITAAWATAGTDVLLRCVLETASVVE